MNQIAIIALIGGFYREHTGISPANCPTTNCPLHKIATGQKACSVKDIRQFCLYCNGGENTPKCTGNLLFPIRSCPLHPFRFGKNPNRKGIGNLNAVAPTQKTVGNMNSRS